MKLIHVDPKAATLLVELSYWELHTLNQALIGLVRELEEMPRGQGPLADTWDDQVHTEVARAGEQDAIRKLSARVDVFADKEIAGLFDENREALIDLAREDRAAWLKSLDAPAKARLRKALRLLIDELGGGGETQAGASGER